MKKLIIILFAIALVSAFSCNKSYTCYCANYAAGTDTSFTVHAINSTRAFDSCYWQTLNHTATCVFE